MKTTTAAAAENYLGEIYRFIRNNGCVTNDLEGAFSAIHYSLKNIADDKYHCDTCANKDKSGDNSPCNWCTKVSSNYIPENVPLSKKVLGGIVNYLSLDLKCKFSPDEYCDGHVDCVDCDIAKAQSITLQRIEKEFAEWLKNGI